MSNNINKVKNKMDSHLNNVMEMKLYFKLIDIFGEESYFKFSEQVNKEIEEVNENIIFVSIFREKMEKDNILIFNDMMRTCRKLMLNMVLLYKSFLHNSKYFVKLHYEFKNNIQAHCHEIENLDPNEK